jgi:two-component system, chemotaxis family, chemotaxis protein CheY
MAQILVVDDSGYARRTMRKTLEGAAHSVTEANGGMAAIECYYLNRPDLVLLDLTMEDVGGFDVLRQLREIDPAARVIVVSADVQQSTAKLVEAAGGSRFLGKPVQAQELLDAIDAVLSEAKG